MINGVTSSSPCRAIVQTQIANRKTKLKSQPQQVHSKHELRMRSGFHYKLPNAEAVATQAQLALETYLQAKSNNKFKLVYSESFLESGNPNFHLIIQLIKKATSNLAAKDSSSAALPIDSVHNAEEAFAFCVASSLVESSSLKNLLSIEEGRKETLKGLNCHIYNYEAAIGKLNAGDLTAACLSSLGGYVERSAESSKDLFHIITYLPIFNFEGSPDLMSRHLEFLRDKINNNGILFCQVKPSTNLNNLSKTASLYTEFMRSGFTILYYNETTGIIVAKPTPDSKQRIEEPELLALV